MKTSPDIAPATQKVECSLPLETLRRLEDMRKTLGGTMDMLLVNLIHKGLDQKTSKGTIASQDGEIPPRYQEGDVRSIRIS